MKSKISAGTIARTIVLFLALLNQVLAFFGVSPLQIADADIGSVVSLLWSMAASVVSWWKNNSFTQAAIQADETLKRHREA